MLYEISENYPIINASYKSNVYTFSFIYYVSDFRYQFIPIYFSNKNILFVTYNIEIKSILKFTWNKYLVLFIHSIPPPPRTSYSLCCLYILF